MCTKRAWFVGLLFFSLSFGIFAQSPGIFLYVPTDQEMGAFMGMHQFLLEWEDGKRELSAAEVAELYAGNVGAESLNGLQFEAFLRFTANQSVRTAVLSYIESKGIDDPFSACVKKLWASTDIDSRVDGERASRRVYGDVAFDEGIDLFNFFETAAFDRALGFILFDEAWEEVPLDGSIVNGSSTPLASADSFCLIAGGPTNSLTAYFKKHRAVKESGIDGLLSSEIYPAKFPGWKTYALEPKGILAGSGADRYVVAYGIGPDSVPDIDCGSFNAYLYDRDDEILYEMSLSMNFSALNVNYPVRARIYNYLLFNTLFCFLEKKP